MIFVTVGSELPFDRMIRAVDEWAGHHPDIPVFAQIGVQDSDGFTPQHLDHENLLSPEQYQQYVGNCSLMIAHAGMGSIITALQAGTPLVIMPRREKFRETRNDHQVGTGERFNEYDSIFYAADENAINDCINSALSETTAGDAETAVSAYASDDLLTKLQTFIHS